MKTIILKSICFDYVYNLESLQIPLDALTSVLPSTFNGLQFNLTNMCPTLND